MAASDPDPHSRSSRRQLFRTMRLAAIMSVATAALAIVLLARGDSAVRVHMLIATALGVGLSVLLGSALAMLLVLRNRIGHDQAATDNQQKDDDEPRS
jgi:predicted signal transduction protein with EAL and GGDEF domain